ncbi:MAG: NUDIX hydrolase [Candidatus Hydrogenedentes bacterium]|nr:NUDIX hydrolase [Candidatus Hydrogenedentota bacterium]
MSTQNPWKRIEIRTVYTNPWLSLREDRVIRPDGEPGIYTVVETRVATGVVALTPDEEIYLIGQYRYPTDEYSWEIVEGGSDPGEDPLETAKRELREEAGLVAKQWAPLGGKIRLSNCISSEVGRLYLARDLCEVAPEPDGTEVLQIKKIPFAEALEMVDAGEIKDAMSILGILRAARISQ